MKRKVLIVLVLAILWLTSCGPSPEEIATMTAAAWTATPEPTLTPTITPSPTPTPIPYNLTVTISDADGNPIAGASIMLNENDAVLADASGMATWNNLPDENASFSVQAQGYFANEVAQTIERGPNEIEITLEKDPFGLMPSQACTPNETLLYIEDFQDGKAEGWPEIEFGAPGWALIEDPAAPANTILAASYSEGTDGGTGAGLQELSIENGVWRLKYFVDGNLTGENSISFNWLQAHEIEIEGVEVFDSRYQIPTGYNYFAMRRLQQPIVNVGIGQTSAPKTGEWHFLEISTLDGHSEIWIDGARKIKYDDPKPLPAGTITLEVWMQSNDATIYIDDISVCELSAPFESIYTEENVE